MKSYKARIKFDNREWLVIDNIEYEGIKYYYIIEDISEELEKLDDIDKFDGTFNMEFIYNLHDERYKNVTDQELISKLSALVAIKKLAEDNKEAN